MVHDSLTKWMQSKPGVVLYVLVHLAVVAGLPIGGYFARQVLTNTNRIVKIETIVSHGVFKELQSYKNETNRRFGDIGHRLDRIDSKLDAILERGE